MDWTDLALPLAPSPLALKPDVHGYRPSPHHALIVDPTAEVIWLYSGGLWRKVGDGRFELVAPPPCDNEHVRALFLDPDLGAPVVLAADRSPSDNGQPLFHFVLEGSGWRDVTPGPKRITKFCTFGHDPMRRRLFLVTWFGLEELLGGRWVNVTDHAEHGSSTFAIKPLVGWDARLGRLVIVPYSSEGEVRSWDGSHWHLHGLAFHGTYVGTHPETGAFLLANNRREKGRESFDLRSLTKDGFSFDPFEARVNGAGPLCAGVFVPWRRKTLLWPSAEGEINWFDGSELTPSGSPRPSQARPLVVGEDLLLLYDFRTWRLDGDVLTDLGLPAIRAWISLGDRAIALAYDGAVLEWTCEGTRLLAPAGTVGYAQTFFWSPADAAVHVIPWEGPMQIVAGGRVTEGAPRPQGQCGRVAYHAPSNQHVLLGQRAVRYGKHPPPRTWHYDGRRWSVFPSPSLGPQGGSTEVELVAYDPTTELIFALRAERLREQATLWTYHGRGEWRAHETPPIGPCGVHQVAFTYDQRRRAIVAYGTVTLDTSAVGLRTLPIGPLLDAALVAAGPMKTASATKRSTSGAKKPVAKAKKPATAKKPVAKAKKPATAKKAKKSAAAKKPAAVKKPVAKGKKSAKGRA